MKVTYVVWDCVRADAVNDTTTPFLTNLPGYHFAMCRSHAPWTVPAVMSLLAGQVVAEHGYDLVGPSRHLGKKRVRKNMGAVLAHDILGMRGDYSHDENPILRHYLPCGVVGDGKALFTFRLWMNAHMPLTPSREALQAMGIDFDPKPYTRWQGHEQWGKQERHNKRLVYDAAVWDLDSRLQALWPQINDGVVVVTADHGEEFWDHETLEREHYEDPRDIHGIGHGHTLFEELLRVPLVIYAPQLEQQILETSVDFSHKCVNSVVYSLMREQEPDWGKLSNKPHMAEGIAYGWRKEAQMMGRRKTIFSRGPEPDMEFTLPDEQTWASPGYTPEEDAEMTRHLEELGYG